VDHATSRLGWEGLDSAPAGVRRMAGAVPPC
jgi:hypothetical protein